MSLTCTAQTQIHPKKKTKCHSCKTNKGVYFKCKFCQQHSCSSCVQPEVHNCLHMDTVRENTKRMNEKQLFDNACKGNKVVPI